MAPLGAVSSAPLDAAARAKVEAWAAAKKAKDYARADKVREELRAGGIDAERAAQQLQAQAQQAQQQARAAKTDAKTDANTDARADATSEAKEEMTPLGHHIARMPLEPRIAKILIYGALLGCIDPALTIAAAMSLSRSPFLTPSDKRQEANAARADFVRERSDHMALLRA